MTVTDVVATDVVATDELISVNGDNGVRDMGAEGKAGALLFASGKDDEAVGDAGALVGTGVLPDRAVDLKRRATMRDYGTPPDSLVRC